MKIPEVLQKFAAKQGGNEDEALKKGMDETSKGFVDQSAEVYAKAQV